MHAVELIGPCLPDELLDGAPLRVNAVCAVTGNVEPCVPRKFALGKCLLNMDFLTSPNSEWVGVNAYKVMSHKWARMSSWFCDGKEFRRIDRQGIRDLVIAGRYPPVWMAYATTSYKKHGALYGRVNFALGQAMWRFENVNVDCSDRIHLMEIWTEINKAIRSGISRPVIESLEPNHFAFKAVGFHGWQNFSEWARPLFRSRLYQFLCFLLPSQEELKNEQAA